MHHSNGCEIKSSFKHVWLHLTLDWATHRLKASLNCCYRNSSYITNLFIQNLALPNVSISRHLCLSRWNNVNNDAKRLCTLLQITITNTNNCLRNLRQARTAWRRQCTLCFLPQSVTLVCMIAFVYFLILSYGVNAPQQWMQDKIFF